MLNSYGFNKVMEDRVKLHAVENKHEHYGKTVLNYSWCELCGSIHFVNNTGLAVKESYFLEINQFVCRECKMMHDVHPAMYHWFTKVIRFMLERLYK